MSDLRRHGILLRAVRRGGEGAACQGRERLDTLQGRTLSHVLITTDHVVFEILILILTTVDGNAHARAVQVGERLYSERLARIYRAQLRGAARSLCVLRQHKDKRYSAVDCLSGDAQARHSGGGPSTTTSPIASLPGGLTRTRGSGLAKRAAVQ